MFLQIAQIRIEIWQNAQKICNFNFNKRIYVV